MATGRETKLTGSVGEFRVAAELCRRGLLATPFAGNVPHYDVIASGQRGGHLAIQVKAINGSTWQFDVRRFLKIRRQGRRQIAAGLQREPYPDLFCVLVALSKSEPDRFFVLTWRELRRIVALGYRSYLRKHGGVRPKAPDSFHTTVSIDEVERFEGQWKRLSPNLAKMPNKGSQPSAARGRASRRG